MDPMVSLKLDTLEELNPVVSRVTSAAELDPYLHAVS
jgi:hypothetical protein